MQLITIVACFCLSSGRSLEQMDGMWQTTSRNSSKALVRSSSTTQEAHEAPVEATIGADGALSRARKIHVGHHLASEKTRQDDEEKSSKVLSRVPPPGRSTNEESSFPDIRSRPSTRVQDLAAVRSNERVSFVETVRDELFAGMISWDKQRSSLVALFAREHDTAKAEASSILLVVGAAVAAAVVGLFVWRFRQRQREQAAVQIQAVFRGGQQRSDILAQQEQEDEDK